MHFLIAVVCAFIALSSSAFAQATLPPNTQVQPQVQIRPDAVRPIACTARPAALTDGVYSIHLRSSGKSLDASNNGSFREMSPVIGWDAIGSSNQRWLVTTIRPGQYMVRNAANAMAMRASPLCRTRNACPVHTTRATRGDEQAWIIESLSTGGYRLRMSAGGMQLSLADRTANGAAAQTSPAGCGANQVFEIARIGDYRELSHADGLGRLMSIDLRLNNYTPRAHEFEPSGEAAFFRPNASHVSFRVGDRTFGPLPINLPVIPLGPDRMYKTYVNDWNSETTTVSTNRQGAIVVRIDFEDHWPEIITHCYNNANCHIGSPRFDLRNSRVTVTLQPRYDASRRAFTFDATTDFQFEMSESGPCVDNFWAFICDLALPDRASLLRSAVIDALDRNLAADGSIGRRGLELVLNSYAGGGFQNVTVGPNGELVFY